MILAESLRYHDVEVVYFDACIRKDPDAIYSICYDEGEWCWRGPAAYQQSRNLPYVLRSIR